MPSEEDIANSALTLLGAKPILSLTQTDSVAAAMCNRHLPLVRDAVQRGFPWKCVRHRATLAKDATDPDWGWDHRYLLPAEPNYCLRVWKMKEEEDAGTPWTVEGRYLLTDSDTCSIMYLQRVKDPNLWDALLQSAIAARLASEIAYKVTGSKTLVETMFQAYKLKKREAQFTDSQEGTPDDFIMERVKNARRGG